MARIFLSHSSADEAEAIALREWLRVQGWDDVFLDIDPERGLKPGDRWQKELRAAADRCEAVLLVLSPAWLKSLWCNLEFAFARSEGKAIFGVLVKPVEVSELPADMTAEWQLCRLFGDTPEKGLTVQTRQGPVDVGFSEDGLRRLKDGLLKSGLDSSYYRWPPETDPHRSPYRGLEPLGVEDAAIYFGRDVEVLRGMDRLREMRQSALAPVFVVLGPSGTGKSSFLRAGLMPRLQRDDRHYCVLDPMRPELAAISGEEHGLARVLHTALCRAPGGPRINLARVREPLLAGKTEHLRELLDQIRRASAPHPPIEENVTSRALPTAVLAIDQAEELFHRDSGSEGAILLSLLGHLLRTDRVGAALDNGPLPLLVAFTIRSERFEALQNAPELQGVRFELFDDLRPMPKQRFADIIRRPAERARVRGQPLDVKAELVDRLVEECGAGGDTLPLLSLTLSRLYDDYGSDGDLRLDEYEQMGGMAQIVKIEVESILARNPSHERARQLELLRGAFIPWLATFDPDTDQPIRRLARMQDIPAESHALIDALAERRLLLKDRRGGVVLVEVAHEALLRRWDVLAGWLQEEREDLKDADALLRARDAWEANGHNEAWLLQGMRLTNAQQLAARPRFVERLRVCDDFLGASRAKANEVREAEERSRQAALDAANRLAAEQTARAEAEQQAKAVAEQSAARLRRRSTALATALALAALSLVVTAGLALYSREQARLADEGARKSVALAATGQALRMLTNELDGGVERAYQQLIAAHRLAPSAETQGALLTALMSSPSLLKVVNRIDDAFAMALSPDGKSVATLTVDGTLRLLDARTLQPTAVSRERVPGRAHALVYSPDGQHIASAHESGVRLWDAIGLQTRGDPLAGDTNQVNSLIFSPDGKFLIGGGTGEIEVWDMKSRAPAYPALNPAGPGIGLNDLAISPDSRTIASLWGGFHARLWDARTGKLTKALDLDATAHHLEFLPDNSGIVFSDGSLRDGASLKVKAQIIDLNAPEADKLLMGTVFRVSEDGNLLFTERAPNALVTLAMKTGKVGTQHWGPLGMGPVFAENSRADSLLTNELGEIKLWRRDAGPSMTAPLSGHSKPVKAASTSPNGDVIATGDEGAEIRLWNERSRTQLGTTLRGHRAAVTALAFSSDAALLASGDALGNLLLWNVRTGALVSPVSCDMSESITVVAFSPNGQRLVAGSDRGSLCLYDTLSHSAVFRSRAREHHLEVTSIAFHADSARWVTGGVEGNVRVWDSMTGAPIWKPQDRGAPGSWRRLGSTVRAVGFSGDGLKVHAMDGSMLKVWDDSKRALVAEVPVNGWIAATAAFVPTLQYGSHLDHSSNDLRFLDLWSNQPLGPVLRVKEKFSSRGVLALAADASYAVVTNDAGMPVIWPGPTRWISELCARLTRNMSHDEWREWISDRIGYETQCPGLPLQSDANAETSSRAGSEAASSR
jgi:WD40 repeat protein